MEVEFLVVGWIRVVFDHSRRFSLISPGNCEVGVNDAPIVWREHIIQPVDCDNQVILVWNVHVQFTVLAISRLLI